MTQLVLHIGTTKTASTTLQRSVFGQHPDVFYLGKWVPDTSRVWRSEEVCQLFRTIIRGKYEEIDLDKLRTDYRALVTKPAADYRVIVGSNEGLVKLPTEDFLEFLSRLQIIPGGVRVLVLLRNPLTRVPSGYLQQIQGQFIKRNQDDFFGKRPWMSLDDLLSARSKELGGLGKMLSSVTNIRHAIEKLGRGNVGVFLFESMQDNPDKFFRDLSGFLGICPEKTAELVRNSHENSRLTQAGYDYAQKVNSSRVLRYTWRLQRRWGRTRSLRRAEKKSVAPESGAKVELSTFWRERIAMETREDDQWLLDELGLPVDKYNYPL